MSVVMRELNDGSNDGETEKQGVRQGGKKLPLHSKMLTKKESNCKKKKKTIFTFYCYSL